MLITEAIDPTNDSSVKKNILEKQLNFSNSIKKAKTYGLGEFLEIISELSQESTKKGLINRKQKELITLGMALAKGCHRCIDIHHEVATQLGATHHEIQQVRKVVLYTQAIPEKNHDVLWHAWIDSWHEFSSSKGGLNRPCREWIGLGIALIKQNIHLIQLHVHAALTHGSTAEEIFEIMPIALLMDGAPALSQIPHLIDALEKFKINKICL